MLPPVWCALMVISCNQFKFALSAPLLILSVCFVTQTKPAQNALSGQRDWLAHSVSLTTDSLAPTRLATSVRQASPQLEEQLPASTRALVYRSTQPQIPLSSSTTPESLFPPTSLWQLLQPSTSQSSSTSPSTAMISSHPRSSTPSASCREPVQLSLRCTLSIEHLQETSSTLRLIMWQASGATLKALRTLFLASWSVQKAVLSLCNINLQVIVLKYILLSVK